MDAHEPTHGDAWQAVEDAQRREPAHEAREERVFRDAIREALGDLRARNEAFFADYRAAWFARQAIAEARAHTEGWVADVLADARRVTRDERKG